MNGEQRGRVLIADDEEGIRFVLTQFLKQEKYEVHQAVNGLEALQKAEVTPYDLYILDMKMPKMDGMATLKAIRKLYPKALVVMITAFGTQELATEALVAGAYDYFTKPFELEELRIVLRRAMENQTLLNRVKTLEKRLVEKNALQRIIGHSEKLKTVQDLIRRVAGHDITVLITGESGVGKELVAQAIHDLGSGPDKPFVKVNCAAIPEQLLESELFGHEKGAFTGAIASKPGKFEIADGGSILLDEIGEMPLALQAKLLRVLQEKRVERIGETRPRPINVRIMTATNRDLAQMVKNKIFREDLFFRINVVPIHVPPLRERVDDIPILIDHLIGKYSNPEGKQITAITPEALKLLESYPWPGNVRELENVIQRAIIMTTGSVLDVGSFPPTITGRAIPTSVLIDGVNGGPSREGVVAGDETVAGPLAPRIEKIVESEEKRVIQIALRQMNNRRQETADLLGISRKSLHNKMFKYGLLKERERDIE